MISTQTQTKQSRIEQHIIGWFTTDTTAESSQS